MHLLELRMRHMACRLVEGRHIIESRHVPDTSAPHSQGNALASRSVRNSACRGREGGRR